MIDHIGRSSCLPAVLRQAAGMKNAVQRFKCLSRLQPRQGVRTQ